MLTLLHNSTDVSIFYLYFWKGGIVGKKKLTIIPNGASKFYKPLDSYCCIKFHAGTWHREYIF